MVAAQTNRTNYDEAGVSGDSEKDAKSRKRRKTRIVNYEDDWNESLLESVDESRAMVKGAEWRTFGPSMPL